MNYGWHGMSTTLKENRIVHEVVVPHSPAPEITICWEWFDVDNNVRAWVKGDKSRWEVGNTLHSAIGALMCNLDGITVERDTDYWKDDCD